MMKWRLKSNVNSNSLSIIAGNIANLYDEGISIIMIIDLVAELPISNIYKSGVIEVKQYILNGYSLAEAFNKNTKIFPKFFISMVSVGEKSGKLPDVLRALEKYYQKETFIKKNIITSLMYPLVLAFLMITIILFLCIFLIPNFYNVYLSLGIAPPKSCFVVYEIVNFIKENILVGTIYIVSWMIILPTIIVILALNFFRNSKYFSLPIINQVYEYIVVLILYIVIKSGVNISKGINYATSSITSVKIKEKLQLININILNGNTIAESFQLAGNCSSYTISLIKLGEEGGGIEERLLISMQYLEDKIITTINKFIKLLEPFMIILMALCILIFIVIFVLPLFDSLLGGF